MSVGPVGMVTVGNCKKLTRDIRDVSKDNVHVSHLQPLQRFFRSLDDAGRSKIHSMGAKDIKTYCLRDKPVSFGPDRVPKKILVVIIRSVRRRSRSWIARPL